MEIPFVNSSAGYCTLAEAVADWIYEGKGLKRKLRTEGSRLIKRLMQKKTLRAIARRSRLSPTYVSRVLNRQSPISPDAFVRLSAMEGAL